MSLDKNIEVPYAEFGASVYQYEPEYTGEEIINPASQTLNETNTRYKDLTWFNLVSVRTPSYFVLMPFPLHFNKT